MTPESEKVTAIIRTVAEAEILPRFRRLATGDISEKRKGSLVTTADVEAERRLALALRDLAPGSRAFGEEGADADPGLLELLAGPDPVWVIDPVDGTNNFAGGIECFAVIVAYCQGGETLAGWIHDPVKDVTVSARAGEGTWAGGRRLSVAGPAPIADMTGSLGRALGGKLRARAEAGLGEAPRKTVRYRCTGREYQDLALGRLHFARYGGALMPWDHAAGVLIHAEAGGFGRLQATGEPYRPAAKPPRGPLLLAPDEATWKSLHALFGDE